MKYIFHVHLISRISMENRRVDIRSDILTYISHFHLNVTQSWTEFPEDWRRKCCKVFPSTTVVQILRVGRTERLMALILQLCSIKPLQRKRAMRWYIYKSASQTAENHWENVTKCHLCFMYSIEERLVSSSLRTGRMFTFALFLVSSTEQTLQWPSWFIPQLCFRCTFINTSTFLLHPSRKTRDAR